jgi:hypothetical protein
VVLADLDSRRGEAFSSGDADALTDVDAPGSPQLASDQRALRTLVGAGLHAGGFLEVIESVRPLGTVPDGELVEVVDDRPAYQLVRAGDGTVVESVPARGRRRWRVVLAAGPAGWQVRSVEPNGPAG